MHSFEQFSLFCKKGSIQKGGIPFEISTSSENKAIVWIHFICLKLSNEHFFFKMNFKEIGNVRLGKCNNHEITLLAITCTIYFFEKKGEILIFYFQELANIEKKPLRRSNTKVSSKERIYFQ